MVKVITYGTYDLLHYGHIRLLERAKALGDYLIVGVTADDFDMNRGKINVQQSLIERIEAVKATGLADEIIIEEYEGQKIDDIRRYGIDIFTVGSDWEGKFDYLSEYCKVVYLDRTNGVSSSDIRSEKAQISLGLVGNYEYLNKFLNESKYVNGLTIVGICCDKRDYLSNDVLSLSVVTDDLDELLKSVDAVYIHSKPQEHYSQIRKALNAGKHVMCESPITLNEEECKELLQLAKERKLILMDSLRTAYSTAFDRMVLAVKSGKIGEVVSVDAVCTSLKIMNSENDKSMWSSIAAWGPTALLPVFDIFGTDYDDIHITTRLDNKENIVDSFTKIDLKYKNAVASIKVGCGVKSEGELIVSGTNGYAYVPAPWWKTDYYEFRYENQGDNKRFFYQLDGEGIRNELVCFLRAISFGNMLKIPEELSLAFSNIMNKFYFEKEYEEI